MQWDQVVAQYERLRASRRQPTTMCRARGVLAREGMAAWMRLASLNPGEPVSRPHAPTDMADGLTRTADQNELTLILATMALSCVRGQQEVSP